MVEWSKLPESEEPDAEDVRRTILQLSTEYADGLREHVPE